MAIISAGILGRTSGKVASVVGGRWKGINYIREKVVPKNPQTPLQMAQRSNMRFAVAWAKTMIGVLLIPFLDRFTRRKSAYNDLVGRNVMQFEGVDNPNTIPADSAGIFGNAFRVSRGSLAAVPGLTFAVATGAITLTWDPANVGTLLANDYVLANVSTLDGSQPAVQVLAQVSTGTLVIPATATASMTGKRILLAVLTVRFKRPVSQDVPEQVSNSRTSIITR
jgi:hypothetical protein